MAQTSTSTLVREKNVTDTILIVLMTATGIMVAIPITASAFGILGAAMFGGILGFAIAGPIRACTEDDPDDNGFLSFNGRISRSMACPR